MDHEERIAGALLGTALGDAAGLATEGLSTRAASRRFCGLARSGLPFGLALVSDDTEQSVLLGEALLEGGEDDAEVLRSFRRALRGWLWRLPFGLGLATLRACLRLTLGIERSGVRSAGNGAAMRAGILGVVLADAPDRRVRLGRALASVTHTDPRAIDGALFVAELSALSARADASVPTSVLARRASSVVSERSIREAIDRALALARDEVTLEDAARSLGHTGFVVHSIGLSVFCFARFGASCVAIERAIAAGGDTDTHAAIIGGWVGARLGAGALPRDLLERLRGPFGHSHLRALARALARSERAPRWSRLAALARNLAVVPVIVLHAVRRTAL